MPLGSLTVTYSLNVNTTSVPLTGTFTVPGLGLTLTMEGGMVSFSPPVGAWVVFAQECENIVDRMMIAAGIKGKNLERNFFIMVFASFKNQAYMSLLTTLCMPSIELSFRIILSRALLSCTFRSM